MAFASWWYKTHVNEKNIGSSSKPGEKKGSKEVTASSAATSNSPSISTTEAKTVKTESEKSQSSEKGTKEV